MNTSDKAFEEWLDTNPVIFALSEYEINNMRATWNASRNNAIDEVIKTIERNKCEADGYHACSQQDVFIDKIKELKE